MTQTYDNHVRIVPAYHYVVFGILVVNLGWQVFQIIHSRSLASLISFLLACGLILLAYYARAFSLVVQDRIIRLEMTLRLQRLVRPDLQPHISDFTVDQLIAMRFASDEELPELARKVFDQSLCDRNAIKKMIRQWRPDLLRA